MKKKTDKNSLTNSELVVKNLPANAGDTRDADSIPESGRSSGKEVATHSSILAWRISMDRGAWRAVVYGAAELDTTAHWTTTGQQPFARRKEASRPGSKSQISPWGGRDTPC